MDRSVTYKGAVVELVLARSTVHGWRRIATAVSAAAALALTGCAAANADTPGSAPGSDRLPDLVMIERPGLYPEGVEWDAKRQRFLVSSAADGSVTAVHDNGTLSTLDSGEDSPAPSAPISTKTATACWPPSPISPPSKTRLNPGGGARDLRPDDWSAYGTCAARRATPTQATPC